jgi:DNA-binding SARP family transcriptional activator
MRLCFFALGSFEVCWGDAPIPHRRTGKGLTILKYLAARPRQRVPRDVLLEVLWPEAEPKIANNRLKVAVHHLRQVYSPDGHDSVGTGCVVFRDGCYMLDPAVEVWSDVEAFEEAWRTGLRLDRAGRPSDAVPLYARAEALYRGDYLEEDPFEEWTLLRREELRGAYLSILDKLGRHRLQTGDSAHAMETWRVILTKDPYREDVYRHLMLCCARLGQRGQAHHLYDLCVQILRDELQSSPEPETVALHDRILAGDALDAVSTGQEGAEHSVVSNG